MRLPLAASVNVSVHTAVSLVHMLITDLCLPGSCDRSALRAAPHHPPCELPSIRPTCQRLLVHSLCATLSQPQSFSRVPDPHMCRTAAPLQHVNGPCCASRARAWCGPAQIGPATGFLPCACAPCAIRPPHDVCDAGKSCCGLFNPQIGQTEIMSSLLPTAPHTSGSLHRGRRWQVCLSAWVGPVKRNPAPTACKRAHDGLSMQAAPCSRRRC